MVRLRFPNLFQFPMEGVGHQGTGCRQMHIQYTSQPNPPSVLGKHGFTGFVLCKMYISCFFFFLRIQLCKHEEDNKQYEGKHRDRTQGRPREGIFQRARHYDSLPVPQEIKNLLQPQSSTIYDLRTKQPLSFPRVDLSWDIQIGSAPLKRSGMVTGGAGCPEQAAVGGSIGRRHKWLCASSHLGNHVQPHQRLFNIASTIPSVNSNEFREITHGTNINMSVPTGIFNPERPFCFFLKRLQPHSILLVVAPCLAPFVDLFVDLQESRDPRACQSADCRFESDPTDPIFSIVYNSCMALKYFLSLKRLGATFRSYLGAPDRSKLCGDYPSPCQSWEQCERLAPHKSRRLSLSPKIAQHSSTNKYKFIICLLGRSLSISVYITSRLA